jgi:hypothetical protein
MEKFFEDFLKNNIKKMYNKEILSRFKLYMSEKRLSNIFTKETFISYIKNIDYHTRVILFEDIIKDTIKDLIDKVVNEEKGYDNFVKSCKYKQYINNLLSYGLGLTILYWGERDTPFGTAYERKFIIGYQNKNYGLLFNKIIKQLSFLFEETNNQKKLKEKK